MIPEFWMFIFMTALAGAIVSVLSALSSWHQHVLITRKEMWKKRVAYREFKKLFNSFEWYEIDSTTWGLENIGTGCIYHRGRILMDHVGIILRDPISYILTARYVRYYAKRIHHSDGTHIGATIRPAGYTIKQPDGTLIFIKEEEIYPKLVK